MAEKLPEYNHQPENGGPEHINAPPLTEGVYILVNKASNTQLDLEGGRPGNGTKCQGWRRVYNQNFASSRWILRQDGVDGCYSLMNMKGGSCLDLEGGCTGNGAEVRGWFRPPESWLESRANQEWRIQEVADGFYTLQNVRTSNFLELEKGSKDDGTWIVCSARAEEKDSQLWELEKVSRSGEEIIALLGDWNEPLLSRLCQPYSRDAQYFVIPEELRRDLWDRTGLRTQSLRKHIYDHDDFIIKAKEAVSTWARDNIKVDGFGPLFGLMYGRAPQGPRAYNWYLSPDMHSLVFFDAQTGRELTGSALLAKNFQPSFAVF